MFVAAYLNNPAYLRSLHPLPPLPPSWLCLSQQATRLQISEVAQINVMNAPLSSTIIIIIIARANPDGYCTTEGQTTCGIKGTCEVAY